MIGSVLARLTRLLTGARARWEGCLPEVRQRVFFANHTSNLDFVLLWASLPSPIRRVTRPVAAQDYWRGGFVREYLASQVFRAVLIERKHVTRDNNPLTPMLESLTAGDSLIIFPEGTRHPDGLVGEFKPGIFHLAKACPEVEFVPVFIENLNRVLPKGEYLPVPVLCSVNFGAPLRLAPGEAKSEFLTRSRDALLRMNPA